MMKGGESFAHLDRVTGDQFAAVWNAAESLDGVAAGLRAIVGPPVPRWWVLGRAASLRRDGVGLKPMAGGR